MKNIKIIGLFILASFAFTSCEDDDNLVYTAQVPSENVAFTSTFLIEYVLTEDAKNNIAERFVWNSPDFGIATPNSYDLEGAITEDFAEVVVLGTTAENNLGITVAEMLELATTAGLDNDPNTTDVPNAGSLYFRVRAYIGDGGENAPESFSTVTALNVLLPEDVEVASGVELSSWGIVGSAANDWGATPDIPFYTTEDPNIIISYANLIAGEIKFRENNTWGGDLGDATLDGILDADENNNIVIAEAGTFKVTINLSDKSYTMEEYFWGIVGSAAPNGWDGPNTKLEYDYTTDTFKAVVELIDGEVKLRMNDTWDTSYGDGNLDGILDTDADNNIAVTAGFYLLTVNFNTLAYTLEETTIWGLVGSATPNGWDGPDTKFMPDFANPGIWTIDSIDLVDGQIKVRANDTWDLSYGDLELDGILDTENENNINVTAGTYKIVIDFSDEASPTIVIE
ncbi:SusE domain-containing protein [Cellulophaga baltica]|uniref:SusE domain-containing protein n=1 Tax=Cellulophaga baltica TaxID=76594 RepID=UPI0004011F9D|nr:SusF/SusE family outer membrane protein [Cellulophaga baltica]